MVAENYPQLRASENFLHLQKTLNEIEERISAARRAYNGKDFVGGKVVDTDIAFSEVHAEYKTETIDMKGRKRTNWHTIFKGVLFVAKFPKRAKGKLQLT